MVLPPQGGKGSGRAAPDQLSAGIRALYKRNILHSLGCALGALNSEPFARLRAQSPRAAYPAALRGIQ